MPAIPNRRHPFDVQFDEISPKFIAVNGLFLLEDRAVADARDAVLKIYEASDFSPNRTQALPRFRPTRVIFHDQSRRKQHRVNHVRPFARPPEFGQKPARRAYLARLRVVCAPGAPASPFGVMK